MRDCRARVRSCNDVALTVNADRTVTTLGGTEFVERTAEAIRDKIVSEQGSCVKVEFVDGTSGRVLDDHMVDARLRGDSQSPAGLRASCHVM